MPTSSLGQSGKDIASTMLIACGYATQSYQDNKVVMNCDIDAAIHIVLVNYCVGFLKSASDQHNV